MSALQKLLTVGGMDSLDQSLGQLLVRLDGTEEADLVGVAGALASHARRGGHSAIQLKDWAGQPYPGSEGPEQVMLPDLQTWEEALRASPIVGEGADGLPLVLEEGTLSFLRFWEAEPGESWVARR